MTKYSIASDVNGEQVIQRINDDGSVDSIPSDPANSDYVAYLATLSA